MTSVSGCSHISYLVFGDSGGLVPIRESQLVQVRRDFGFKGHSFPFQVDFPGAPPTCGPRAPRGVPNCPRPLDGQSPLSPGSRCTGDPRCCLSKVKGIDPFGRARGRSLSPTPTPSSGGRLTAGVSQRNRGAGLGFGGSGPVTCVFMRLGKQPPQRQAGHGFVTLSVAVNAAKAFPVWVPSFQVV